MFGYTHRISDMKKLTRLLRRAHAIEIGAFYAYDGHWKSLPDSDPAKHRIYEIQFEELLHRLTVLNMLRRLDAKPSPTQDFILWCIGKTISFSCYLMGRRAAMWGARIMEVMGKNIYVDIAEEALDQGRNVMAYQLGEMAMAEMRHQRFFEKVLYGN